MMPSAANATQPLSPAGTVTGLGAGVARSPQQKIGPIGNGPVVGVFVIAVGARGVNVGAEFEGVQFRVVKSLSELVT
jgi:hypothetical protein